MQGEDAGARGPGAHGLCGALSKIISIFIFENNCLLCRPIRINTSETINYTIVYWLSSEYVTNGGVGGGGGGGGGGGNSSTEQ